MLLQGYSKGVWPHALGHQHQHMCDHSWPCAARHWDHLVTATLAVLRATSGNLTGFLSHPHPFLEGDNQQCHSSCSSCGPGAVAVADRMRIGRQFSQWCSAMPYAYMCLTTQVVLYCAVLCCAVLGPTSLWCRKSCRRSNSKKVSAACKGELWRTQAEVGRTWSQQHPMQALHQQQGQQ